MIFNGHLVVQSPYVNLTKSTVRCKPPEGPDSPIWSAPKALPDLTRFQPLRPPPSPLSPFQGLVPAIRSAADAPWEVSGQVAAAWDTCPCHQCGAAWICAPVLLRLGSLCCVDSPPGTRGTQGPKEVG